MHSRAAACLACLVWSSSGPALLSSGWIAAPRRGCHAHSRSGRVGSHLPRRGCRLRRSGLPAEPPDPNQTVSCRLGLQPVPASTQASSASATGPGSVLRKEQYVH
eukprot:scaffold116658_cov68-Phaeocystis_antarctica.AAC.1